MTQRFDMISIGVVLSLLSIIMFTVGIENQTSLWLIIIIALITFVVPLGLFVYSIYLLVKDRVKYTNQFIVVSTYNVIFISFMFVIIIWMMF